MNLENRKAIKAKNEQINQLKEECVNELNTVNHYFWPIVAKLKRKRKDYVWYFTLACCLLVSVIIWLLFAEIVNEYWIGGSLGGCAIILFLTGFYMVKILKQLKKANDTWEKALVKSNDLKNKIIVESNEAIELMKNEFGDEKEKILAEIGSSYDDILEYYNRLVELD